MGTINVTASTSNSAAPIWIWCFALIPSRPHNQAPASRNAVKVVIRPAAIAYGRLVLPAPPASTIGSTGRMQGVNAVMMPAANAIGTRISILISRS